MSGSTSASVRPCLARSRLAASLPFIEVGHGNGVGSQFFRDPSVRAKSLPLLGDEDHANISLSIAQRARVGVIFTAGRRFCPIDYIDRIADLGYAFIRIAFVAEHFNPLPVMEKMFPRLKSVPGTVA